MRFANLFVRCSLFLLSAVALNDQAFAQQGLKTTFEPNYKGAKFINKPDDGFRGIWYQIGKRDDEYAYKYSGGLATYPSNHYPFSVYVKKVNKTFFCYGGTDPKGKTLYHEVAYFDHKTGEVSRPTIVMDKGTNDAHDNPVMQVDKDGYIWLFSTSHGIERPSFIHRSAKPYDIGKFEFVPATKLQDGKRLPMDNFSYLQVYYTSENGFLGLFTTYETRQLKHNKRNCRDIAFMTSKDGVEWSEWKFLSKIEEGHYQTSGQWKNRIGTSFNYHPEKIHVPGLDYRTNLYYISTDDNGKTWKTANGTEVTLPLKDISNEALVYDYAAEGLNVYINDLNFDERGNPIILYETGIGHEPGPKYGLKQWHVAHWNGTKWNINTITQSDHNYDMGSLYVEKPNLWKIIAPTESGPQQYNTGGEIAVWISKDKGNTWKKEKLLTFNSVNNHSYPRRPINAHAGFYAFWADGNGRKPSKSRLFFSTKKGKVYMLPEVIDYDRAKPKLMQRFNDEP